MPLRPRIDVRCEYLLTPISIFYSEEGKKILCLSDIKAGAVDPSLAYINILRDRIGPFHLVIKDSNPEFIAFAKKTIPETLNPYKKLMVVRSCLCGAYEELQDVRMFDLHRIVDNACVFCKTPLRTQEMEVLLSDIFWPQTTDFLCNRNWASKDLAHFLERQIKRHKISKRSEKVSVRFWGTDFGIRYQVLWAVLIVFLAKTENDTNITVHYVQKVQDKTFFVCSLAKMMHPDLNIHLNALPIVWVKDSPLIPECHPSHIKLMSKTLGTKRKDLRVSLKSWRY